MLLLSSGRNSGWFSAKTLQIFNFFLISILEPKILCVAKELNLDLSLSIPDSKHRMFLVSRKDA